MKQKMRWKNVKKKKKTWLSSARSLMSRCCCCCCLCNAPLDFSAWRSVYWIRWHSLPAPSSPALFPACLQSPRLDCIFDSSRAWTLQMRRRLAAVAPAIKSPFAEKKVPYPLCTRPPLPLACPWLASALIAPRSVAALIMWILNIYKKLSAKISAKNFINYFYSGDFSFFFFSTAAAALEISSLVCASVCVCTCVCCTILIQFV